MRHTIIALLIVLALALVWGVVVVLVAEEPAPPVEKPIKRERVIWV